MSYWDTVGTTDDYSYDDGGIYDGSAGYDYSDYYENDYTYEEPEWVDYDEPWTDTATDDNYIYTGEGDDYSYEVYDDGGDMFRLPTDYWEEGTADSFWSQGIYDMDQDTIQAYIDSGEDFGDSEDIKNWMESHQEDDEGGLGDMLKGLKDFFGENKELMALLAKAGLGALSGYKSVKKPTRTSRSRGGGGGGSEEDVQTTMGGDVGVLKVKRGNSDA